MELSWTQVLVVLALVLWAGYGLGAARWRRRYEAAEDDLARYETGVRTMLGEEGD